MNFAKFGMWESRAGIIYGPFNPIYGLGFALFSSPNMSAIMGSVARHQYGLASGTAATMRLLGQMTSMATATVVLALLVGREAIAPENYDRFLLSVRTAFTISALLCAAGIFFSLFRGRLRLISFRGCRRGCFDLGQWGETRTARRAEQRVVGHLVSAISTFNESFLLHAGRNEQ